MTSGGERTTARPPKSSHVPPAVRLLLARLGGLWLAIILIAIVFGTINHNFFLGANLLDLVRSASAMAIVALGETLVIIAAELDLSIGSTFSFGPILLGVLWMNHGVGLYEAIVLSLLAAALIGFVNGFLTTVVQIPSFVVTLGTLSLINGISLLIGKAQYFTPEFTERPLPKGELNFFHQLGGSTPFGVPAEVIWLVVVAAIFTLILHRSLFGFRLSAVGGNPAAARVARLPVRRYRITAFVICAVMAAVAGIIEFSFLGSTQSSTSGSTLTFPVFAAVIIGGASLSGGSGTVIGTLTGALLLTELSNGLALIGVGGGAQQVFVGLVTIGAVALDRWASHGSRLRSLVRRS